MSERFDRLRALELAERFVRNGKLQEAINQYEKILAVDSEDSSTLNIVGDLYSQTGQKGKAAEVLLRAAEEYERRGMFAQALAVFKKIYKLAPEKPETSLKLGELYAREGFIGDAKAAYLSAAGYYSKKKDLVEAIKTFEKILALDHEDLETKKELAGLYKRQGYFEACLEQMNDVAESMIGRGETGDARKLLNEAMTIDPVNVRTVANMVELLRRAGKLDEGLKLVEEKLKAKPEEVQLLNLMGNILFEKEQMSKAEEVFSRIVSSQPMNVNARIKLGRIHVLNSKFDDAFELFLPLIDSLIKKHKDEKAVGLLGLILEARENHLPSLEKLASIYRMNRDMKRLEVVDKVILRELKAGGETDRMLIVLEELRNVSPGDKQVKAEYEMLSGTGSVKAEEGGLESSSLDENDRAVISETLDQADLYLEQGLVRNARRILENLRSRFPDETRILKKLSVIDEVKTHIDESELKRRIEKTSVLEMQQREKGSAGAKAGEREEKEERQEKQERWGPFAKDVIEGDKVSTADIFAETDIIPFIPSETGDMKYYDLEEEIKCELRMLAESYKQQVQGEMGQYERGLSNIVEEFRKDLETKVKTDDYDTHFNLGIAFMEQGLYREAIDELSVAAQDKKLAVECFSLISYCHKQSSSYDIAVEWLDRALKMVRGGTEQYYALTYDLAELFENVDNPDQAVELFKEIIAWNPRYRDISRKMERLTHDS